MDSLIQDIRFGLRGFIHSPGFTFTAVLALALGIGANTAIFSVVNPFLFRPLPFPNSERLVSVVPYRLTSGEEGNLSYPDYLDVNSQVKGLDGFAAFAQGSVAVKAIGEPTRTKSLFTTSNLFTILGAPALLGRTLEKADDAPDAPPVVVLSHALWSRDFAASPHAIGQTVQIDGKSFTVVGVMPHQFRLPDSARGHGVYIPLKLHSHPEFLESRGHHNLLAIGRLKTDISIEQGTAELAGIATQLETQFPDAGHIRQRIKLVRLQERATKDMRPMALVLLAAVGLVLLIACANVANLLLARASARQREFAIRRSLGASSARLARQVLTESLILSLLGAGVGLLLSLWMTDSLKALIGARIEESSIDGAVLLFTVGMAAATGLLFGSAPAFSHFRHRLQEALNESGGRASLSRNRQRVQSFLIATQLALAFALLTGAGLMIESLNRLAQINPGFDAHNLVGVRLPLPDWSYSAERKRDFYHRLIESLHTLPGVVAAGGVDPFPFRDGNSRNSVTVEDQPSPPPDEVLHPQMYEVSAEYFQTMGIPIIEGRSFLEVERGVDGPNAIIINQKFAERFWPRESALGKGLYMGVGANRGARFEIVGVVGNVLHGGLDGDPQLQFYIPYEHSAWMDLMIVVRTEGAPDAFIPTLRKLIRSADPNLPINQPQLATQLIEETASNRKITMQLLGAFALVALALAAFGLYGLIAYAVSQRNHEFAIRIALGAQPNDVIRLVMGRGLRIAAVGLGAGVLLAMGGTRLLGSLLYGVGATDLWTYVIIAFILGTAALMASYIPARRATQVSPLSALRAE